MATDQATNKSPKKSSYTLGTGVEPKKSKRSRSSKIAVLTDSEHSFSINNTNFMSNK